MIYNPVLGAIIGDMIGVPYEFLRYGAQVKPDFPLWEDKSTFSDDTVMTLAVAKWLIEDVTYNSDYLIKCMQELGRKYRNRGYGSNFGQWLDSDNPKPYNSWGNGSAMRVSPIGCLNGSDMAIDTLAIKSASVSHNHPEGINGARAITDFIFYIREGKHDLNWIKNLVEETYGYDLSRTPQQIRDVGYKFEVSCQKSVPEAICCFLNSKSYEETIREAILLRGDTDTQACMAGSIAAAYWGIPEDIANEAKERLPQDLYVILSKFSKKYNLDL